MAMRNIHNAEPLERLTDGGAIRQTAKQASFHSDIRESRRQSSVLLVSNYSLETNSFSSEPQVSANWRTSESDLDNRKRRRRSSSFGQYVAHAFALGSKTNSFFGCLLMLNLLMSAINTVFLSLLVKSVQLSDLSLLTSSGQRALDWNAQLGGLELRLAALGENSSLSVQSIESFEGRPLVVSGSGALRHDQQRRPIFISATRPEVGASGRANQLVIGATGEPVEIVANNLVWDRVTKQQLEPASGEQKRQQHTSDLEAQTSRLLELDGGQQSIALPSSSQLRLFPAKASTLLVHNDLDAPQSELAGTLETDLDVQSRHHGDLLCESRQTLRLVSRSGRVNLLGRQSVKFEACQLQLDAKRLHLAEGVEFLDDDIEESPSDGGQQAGELAAFQLALVDGQLLAAG